MLINYRRADTARHAGRLYDTLSARLGEDSVFMDVAGIDIGEDFVAGIERAVAQSDVVVVLIGPYWSQATDHEGQRRLDDPGDFASLEIATALDRDVRVIPVLVDGARMPIVAELPPRLAGLAHRNALELSDARWSYDAGRLIDAIEAAARPHEAEARMLEPEPPPPPAPRRPGRRGWLASWWGTLSRRKGEEHPLPRLPSTAFSVFAPPRLVPGSSFILELWAYRRDQHEEMLVRARRGRLEEVGSKDSVPVAVGSQLEVVLILGTMQVRVSRDALHWRGSPTNASFIVDVPHDAPGGYQPGQVLVTLNGLTLVTLVFEIEVAEEDVPGATLPITEKRITSAFASYATEDRDEVLRRAQGISAVGVDVFLDAISLRAGDDWQKVVRDNIARRDAFYLFWSVAARRSTWVDWEWRCALHERGIECIHPVPLVEPRLAPPPPELEGRHFNDLFLTLMGRG